MAYADHLLSYRMDSNEELIAEKALLKSQRSIFIQQGMGSKTLTRDLRLLEEKLQAVNFVLTERGYSTIIKAQINPNIGRTDFSDTQ